MSVAGGGWHALQMPAGHGLWRVHPGRIEYCTGVIGAQDGQVLPGPCLHWPRRSSSHSAKVTCFRSSIKAPAAGPAEDDDDDDDDDDEAADADADADAAGSTGIQLMHI